MKRNSWLKPIITKAVLTCLIGLSSCFQQSVVADAISSTETVTGFADGAGFVGDNIVPPASFTIELTGLGTDALSSGFLELTTFGDFSNPGEYIDISIEGVSLGRLWDNNILNDSFDGTSADNDRGEQYGTNFSTETTNASAIVQLTESQLDTFLADDGILTVSFDAFGIQVDNLSDDPDEFITATVTIAVPEPSACLFVAFVGLIGTIGRRRTI